MMVSFAPLHTAASPIPLHAYAAMAAITLGTLQMLLPKGTQVHRYIGRVWAILMVVVALSSFFIYELRVIGPFSPIHLLSAYTLYSLWTGVRAAQRGDITEHLKIMRSLYFLALIVTALFTLFPGRIMYRVLFGG